MQSNEEYLDNLLKAAMGSEEETKQQEEDFTSDTVLTPEEIEAMFAGDEAMENADDDTVSEDMSGDFFAEALQMNEQAEDLFSEAEMEEEQSGNLTADSEEALEELLAGLGNVDEVSGEDDEMAEINELLSQSEGGSMLDDDMLALLENTPESSDSLPIQKPGSEASDEIDIFAMDGIDDEEGEGQGAFQTESPKEPSEEEKPVKKKEKKGWFGKRKKKKAQNIQEPKKEEGEEELSGITLTEDGLLDIASVNENGETSEQDQIREKEPKKSGFFRSLLEFMTEEEEEEEEEQKPKKEKKKKGKKKAKAGNGPASEENEALLDEMEEEDKKNKKKKKPKKAKKQPKEKKQEEPSKEDGKKLPKKMVIRIFVMCFSVMALLVIPALLLPEVFSLKDARKAYYKEDYKTAYENLVGKKLNSSDSLLLEKTTILMRVQRKYDSFINYHKMGKATEALNALLEGHGLYIQLQEEAERQGISQELGEIHQDILDNLEYMYGVTQDQAGVLISIEDDAVYTQEVERIAGEGEEITGGTVPAYRSDAEEQPEE